MPTSLSSSQKAKPLLQRKEHILTPISNGPTPVRVSHSSSPYHHPWKDNTDFVGVFLGTQTSRLGRSGIVTGQYSSSKVIENQSTEGEWSRINVDFSSAIRGDSPGDRVELVTSTPVEIDDDHLQHTEGEVSDTWTIVQSSRSLLAERSETSARSSAFVDASRSTDSSSSWSLTSSSNHLRCSFLVDLLNTSSFIYFVHRWPGVRERERLVFFVNRNALDFVRTSFDIRFLLCSGIRSDSSLSLSLFLQ